MRFRAAEPGAHISRLRASRGLGSYQPASRQPPVCGECAAGPRKRRRVRVSLRTVKQPPNRILISAGFAQAAGLRRVCGRSAQTTARKSCTADREAAAEPGAHISQLRGPTSETTRRLNRTRGCLEPCAANRRGRLRASLRRTTYRERCANRRKSGLERNRLSRHDIADARRRT